MSDQKDVFLTRNACICSCKGALAAYDRPARTELARHDTMLSDANARARRARRDTFGVAVAIAGPCTESSQKRAGRTVTFVSAEAVARRLEFVVPGDTAVARPPVPPIQPEETHVGRVEETCVDPLVHGLEDRDVSDRGRWAKIAPLHAGAYDA